MRLRPAQFPSAQSDATLLLLMLEAAKASHHQPEAQHPKSSSYPQERRPITPSFGGKADIDQLLLIDLDL
jgi:hypothetical protein